MSSSRSRAGRVCFRSTCPANTVQRRTSVGWCIKILNRFKWRPLHRCFSAVSASSPFNVERSSIGMRCLRLIMPSPFAWSKVSPLGLPIAIVERLQKCDDIRDVLFAHRGCLAGVPVERRLPIHVGQIHRGQVVEFREAAAAAPGIPLLWLSIPLGIETYGVAQGMQHAVVKKYRPPRHVAQAWGA